MRVAVIGSRSGYPLERVHDFMVALWEKQGPTTILVSGGADGVDTQAETSWLALGGALHSYRPHQIAGDNTREDEFATQLWVIDPIRGENYVKTLTAPEHPTAADYASACLYRDMLIAEEADRAVAFRYRRSRGTTITLDLFKMYGKPTHLYEEG